MATAKTETVLLTRREAAEFLGIKPGTLAVWAQLKKNLPFIKVGNRRTRYRRADLETYLRRRTVKVGTAK